MRRPTTGDLIRLSQQLEADQSTAVDALKQRDHTIGAHCTGQNDSNRLLYWLDHVRPALAGTEQPPRGAYLLFAVRTLLCLAGFLGMAGFLLGSHNGLVNVFMLLAAFVFVQALLSTLSAFALWRSLRGATPATASASPTAWLVKHSLADYSALRDAGGLSRLLYLRYGQEFGALFTAGAVLAFMAVPALKDFAFVWGSTFSPSDASVAWLMDVLALPWQSWLPAATVSAELVSASRFHAAVLPDTSTLSSLRGWWSFLMACLVCYALLPRLLLWLIAKLAYPRKLAQHFTQYPGAELVLARMDAAFVSTQATSAGRETPAPTATQQATAAHFALPENNLVADWCGARNPDSAGTGGFPVDQSNQQVLELGLGTFAADSATLVNALQPDHLGISLLVKSWEPPVGEIADVLSTLPHQLQCTLILVPLPGRPVPARKVADWQRFAGELPFPHTAVQVAGEQQS